MPKSRIRHPKCPVCRLRCMKGGKKRLRRHMKNFHAGVELVYPVKGRFIPNG